jgi:hypothetical protein
MLKVAPLIRCLTHRGLLEQWVDQGWSRTLSTARVCSAGTSPDRQRPHGHNPEARPLRLSQLGPGRSAYLSLMNQIEDPHR